MYLQKIYNFIKSLFSDTFSPKNIAITFLALIIIRLGVENWISNFETLSPSFYLYEFLHTALFFYLLFIIFVFLLTKIAVIPLKISITLILFAFIFSTFPLIIDWIISVIYFDGVPFKSYYLFDSTSGLAKSFVTFFGDKPRDGVTYGPRMMVILSMIFLSIITYFKTRSTIRTVLMFVCIYVIFFLLGSLPSLITFIVSEKHFSATGIDVAMLVASPTTILGNQITHPINSINIKMSSIYMLVSIIVTLFILLKTHRKTTLALIKNIRPIQTLYHLGLLIFGIGIAIVFANAIILPSFFSIIAFILLCIAIILAWYSSVIFNDLSDQKIDQISNPQRPLIKKIITAKQYENIGILLAILSIIIIAMINVYATLVLIVYHALSFLYNTPPLRLKKFPFIATFIAAIASFFVTVIGFITVSTHHSLSEFPPNIAVLLIVAYTISLPIKDLKDLAGDKANDIYTIPVLFGEQTGRTIIAVGVFISFMLSIFAFGTKMLLFPALLAGTLSFWTLVGQKNNIFMFSPKQTIAVVFLIVSIYTIILTFSLFA